MWFFHFITYIFSINDDFHTFESQKYTCYMQSICISYASRFELARELSWSLWKTNVKWSILHRVMFYFIHNNRMNKVRKFHDEMFISFWVILKKRLNLSPERLEACSTVKKIFEKKKFGRNIFFENFCSKFFDNQYFGPRTIITAMKLLNSTCFWYFSWKNFIFLRLEYIVRLRLPSRNGSTDHAQILIESKFRLLKSCNWPWNRFKFVAKIELCHFFEKQKFPFSGQISLQGQYL